MSQAQIDFAVARMREMNVLGAGLAPGSSIGSMTRERWQRTRDFLVAGGMLSAKTDWTRAFDTRFTDHLGIYAA